MVVTFALVKQWKLSNAMKKSIVLVNFLNGLIGPLVLSVADPELKLDPEPGQEQILVAMNPMVPLKKNKVVIKAIVQVVGVVLACWEVQEF